MQARLAKRLSSLERHYAPLMDRPSMIGDLTTVEFISFLSFEETMEFKAVMLNLIDGHDQATLEEFGRIYELVQERRKQGWQQPESTPYDQLYRYLSKAKKS